MSTCRILRILLRTMRTPDSTGRALRNEQYPLFVAEANDPLYVLGALGEDDEVGDDRVVHQAVALLGAEPLALVDHPLRPDYPLHLPYELVALLDRLFR